MVRPARLMLRLLILLLLVQWSFGLTHGPAAGPAEQTTIICSPEGVRTIVFRADNAEDAGHAAGHEDAGPDHLGRAWPGTGHPKQGHPKPGHAAACQFCLNPAGGDLPAAPVVPAPSAVVFVTLAGFVPLPPFSPAPRTHYSRGPPILPQV